MSDELREDRTIAEIYTVFRQVTELVLDGYTFDGPELQGEILTRIDEGVSAHFDSLVILPQEAPRDPDDRTPATSAQSMEDGVFNLVVSLVLFYSQHYNPERAREMVRGYLTQLVEGLSPAPDPETEEETND